jgi:NADPH-dependent 2,4-dienoyl-CoA reductase/sulfur reductase-like enzyme
MKAVIIGNSAAGIAAAYTLRFLKPDAEIIILSKENSAGYSPSLLAHYISGEISHHQIFLYPKKWYRSRAIDLRLDHEVIRVDFSKKRLFCAGGKKVDYDVLMIASGASPLSPFPFEYTPHRVSGLRTIDDAKKIRGWTGKRREVVVIGAGFVGLKVASCLRKRNMEVSVVEQAPRVLGNAVDEEAHQRIASHLMNQGVTLYCDTKVYSLEKQRNRYDLKLTNGTYLEADVVIVSTGVYPNRAFLEGSPLRAGKAIPVNRFQQTELSDVYAAGDVCLSQDMQTGTMTHNPIWPNAVRQGKVAAYNMAGFEATFPGSLVMNSGEFMNMWINIVGTTEGTSGEIESHVFSNQKWYQRLYVQDKRIVKYISIGNVDYTGVITKAISSRIAIDELARTYPASQIPVITHYQ